MTNVIWLEWERCEAGYRIEEFDPRGIDWTTSIGSATKEQKWQAKLTKNASPATIRLLEKWGTELKPYSENYDEPFLVIDPIGENQISYQPFELERSLFREFADTPRTPEGVKQFADRYGRLVEFGPLETVSMWASEIKGIGDGITYWEKNRDSDLGYLVRSFNNTFFRKEGRAPTNVFLQETDDPTHPRLIVQPNNLLAGIWLQFALAVEGNLNYQKCSECPTWFGIGAAEVGRGKTFCSNACSMRAYRKRKAGAQ